ncbi:hypothetical protein PVK06_005581 [Gossypium arboreum]|uniref:DUF4218 domain-containing protein n=1 Tax=Gossypium arboreum TaxID=29729 RepID=A0ABR0QVX7_GOSAR|nr:hypothetical protein PVK06_005581 [Gossypium arboreum]
MVHLVIHLPHEAILGGPVFYRWMYPIERFLSKLKSYCRNKSYPEGSIAEGYLAEECMTFCSRYLEDVETRLNRPNRNAGLNDHNLAETYLFQSYGEPIGKVEIAELNDISWIQAHRYVLFHHDLVEPLRKWKVVLFRCDWADVNTARGIKENQFGFTMLNFSRLIHTGQQLMDEPYVFSSQVKQVFYSKDPTDEGWYVVLRNTPRELFEMGKMRRRRVRDLSIVQNTPNSEEKNSEQQTVVGSSNVPETLDEPEEFQSYLGILARNANMLPINYESWHHMPDSNKNQALANIKERFALEVSDDYIKKALGKRWRDNKSTLKKQYFKKDISLEEKMRNVPPGMLRYQWEDAVRFWNSKKGEDRERVGTSSRQKQKFTHATGSRSFASVAEAEEVKSGQKVGRLQLFEITHKKKDGSPMTSEAREIMETLKEKKAEYEAIASSDSSVNLENIDNRIITEVLGPERYGRV